MDKDKGDAMTLEEAIAIVDAHLRGRYTSIYLFDAWNYILEHYKEEKE